METKTFTATSNYERCDVFLATETGFTRSKIKNLIDDGKVLINGELAKPKSSVKANDTVTLTIPDLQPLEVKPVDIPLDIIYQDDYLAVINKQQGLTVHAGSGTDENTLVNALLFHLDKLSGINGVIRPGIVHRIDKDTSGLLVVAKNDDAHVNLSKQIESKECKRTYIALLEGNLKEDQGVIDTYIERSNKDRTKMAVSNKGKRAITNYKVLERVNGYTLCRFDLQTGRTHQIRVHASYLKHPVVGDTVYGFKNQKIKLNGQLLHAFKLRFTHPKTNEQMEFTAPLPNYFSQTLKKLGFTFDEHKDL